MDRRRAEMAIVLLCVFGAVAFAVAPTGAATPPPAGGAALQEDEAEAPELPVLDEGLSDRQALLEQMDVIGESVAEILREAGSKGESPIVAAQRRVDRALSKAREEA